MFANIQSKPNPVQLEVVSPHLSPPLKGQTCVVHYTGKACSGCSPDTTASHSRVIAYFRFLSGSCCFH
uniref:Uncharacterized protein n=1 Tax=Ficedula albicollis TaxID=59894 RepID=A0A803WGN7_FICAL